MERNDAEHRLTVLINRYNNSLRLENHYNISEETIRTWLNEFLGIFGWDAQNTNQVLQTYLCSMIKLFDEYDSNLKVNESNEQLKNQLHNNISRINE